MPIRDPRPSLAACMYPSLRSNSPEAKQREAQQARDKAWWERQADRARQTLLKSLREMRGKYSEGRPHGGREDAHRQSA